MRLPRVVGDHGHRSASECLNRKCSVNDLVVSNGKSQVPWRIEDNLHSDLTFGYQTSFDTRVVSGPESARVAVAENSIKHCEGVSSPPSNITVA